MTDYLPATRDQVVALLNREGFSEAGDYADLYLSLGADLETLAEITDVLKAALSEEYDQQSDRDRVAGDIAQIIWSA